MEELGWGGGGVGWWAGVGVLCAVCVGVCDARCSGETILDVRNALIDGDWLFNSSSWP